MDDGIGVGAVERDHLRMSAKRRQPRAARQGARIHEETLGLVVENGPVGRDARAVPVDAAERVVVGPEREPPLPVEDDARDLRPRCLPVAGPLAHPEARGIERRAVRREPGGEDVGAAAGSHSRRREWSELARLRPDLLAVMLCGFGVERARRELAQVTDPEALRVLQSAPVWILDGDAYTSRPGPRVVDGAERLQAMLYDREMPGLVRWRPPTRPLPFPPIQTS